MTRRMKQGEDTNVGGDAEEMEEDEILEQQLTCTTRLEVQ
jgi:hypothetical protein